MTIMLNLKYFFIKKTWHGRCCPPSPTLLNLGSRSTPIPLECTSPRSLSCFRGIGPSGSWDLAEVWNLWFRVKKDVASERLQTDSVLVPIIFVICVDAIFSVVNILTKLLLWHHVNMQARYGRRLFHVPGKPQPHEHNNISRRSRHLASSLNFALISICRHLAEFRESPKSRNISAINSYALFCVCVYITTAQLRVITMLIQTFQSESSGVNGRQ